jgi:hypothetical protein
VLLLCWASWILDVEVVIGAVTRIAMLVASTRSGGDLLEMSECKVN